MKPTPAKRHRSSETDWLDIQRRLELARRAVETMTEVDQGRTEQILRERAARLARVSSHTQPVVTREHSIEVIEFTSAGERYAFETAYVGHVLPVGPVTFIPGVPNFVVGVVAMRGNVLSVIDLRSFLGLPLRNLSEPGSIIVLRDGSMEFGVLAEEILGIERYPMDAIEHELATLSGAGNAYLMGVTHGRTAILDANQLLSDPRLVVENT